MRARLRRFRDVADGPGRALWAGRMATQQVTHAEAPEAFVVTPAIDAVCRRAAIYLDTGYPVHFRGSAGTGKTTLAMHLANSRGRPVTLMFGDDSLASSDLVGREKGLQST